ncbi:hypothetical protein KAW08_00130 [bacterium]|nr:hypothetical protein [bacterium]
MELSSFERIMTAMELKEPDKVPIVEFVIDPNVYKAILPEAGSQTDFEEHFDFDGVCCGVKFNKVKENPDGSYYAEWGVFYKPCQEVM